MEERQEVRKMKMTMRRAVLLFLAVCFIAVAAVGCAGPDVAAGTGSAGAEPPAESDVTNDDEVVNLPGEEIDGDGSDIIFDGDIVLPGGEIEESMVDFFTGNVISIEEINGQTHVTIENAEGGQAIFVISDETIFPFSDSFDVGDEVTAWRWFLPGTPMAMIYPPIYDAAVFAAGRPDGSNIRVARFHKWENHAEDYMISQDEMFSFTIDENTIILTQDGNDYIDFSTEVSRRIVVIYGISTRSIPEMATADKMIVLFEGIMALA